MEPTIVSRSDNPALDWLPRTIRFVGPPRQAGHEGATCNSVDALAISGNSVASVFMRLSLGSASLYSDLLHSLQAGTMVPVPYLLDMGHVSCLYLRL